MKEIRIMPLSFVLLACFGMVSTRQGLAAQPSGRQLGQTMDVALQGEGLLVGQVANRQGKVENQSRISLQHNGRSLMRLNTDDQGRFAIKGLKGGVYEVATANGAVTRIRTWRAGSRYLLRHAGHGRTTRRRSGGFRAPGVRLRRNYTG